jgi:hypothetical protein
MRKFLVFVVLAIAACSPHPNSQPPARKAAEYQYRNIEDVRSYWGRMVALYDKIGVIDAQNPDINICLTEGALDMTTPEMGLAIERYLANSTQANLEAINDVELKAYRNGILGSKILLTNGTCSSPSEDSVRFRGATDLRSFWARTVELEFLRWNFVYSTDTAYKACIVDGLVGLTTPEMRVAIERFLAEKTKSNMDAINAAAKLRYADGVLESDPYQKIGEGCYDESLAKTFARLAPVQTRHALLEAFVRMGSEHAGEPIEFRTPAVVDCIATGLDANYSNAYLFAIDRWVADKTRTKWDEMLETDLLAPMSTQADLDKSASDCRRKFPG